MQIKQSKNNPPKFLPLCFLSKENTELKPMVKTFLDKKGNTGFTLIEIMVATSIFVMVVMIAMGAIFTVVDANKKAQSLKSVMNNLNFALETMTRTIKTGQIISVQSEQIEVTDQNGDDVIYQLDGSSIGVTRISGGISSGLVYITAPEVIIKKLLFSPGIGPQPMAYIVVQGEVSLSERIKSDFNIQTTVTQRILNK